MYLNKLLGETFSRQSQLQSKEVWSIDKNKEENENEVRIKKTTLWNGMRGREWKCEEGLKNKKMKRKKKREEFAWWRVNQTWTAKLVWLQVKTTVWPRHDFFQQRQKLLDWCGVESPSPRSCRVVSYKRNLSLDRKVCNWGRLEPRTASKVRKHGRLRRGTKIF